MFPINGLSDGASGGVIWCIGSESDICSMWYFPDKNDTRYALLSCVKVSITKNKNRDCAPCLN